MAKQILFLIFLAALKSWGQQYGFIQYSIKEGLAQTQVTAIGQDHYGNIWIGTVGGVSKFNGTFFENFGRTDGLIGNQINDLLIDEENRVWLGENGGVSLIQAEQIKAFPLKEEQSHYRITHLLKKGTTLYCGTRSNGLLIMEFNADFSQLLTIDHFLVDKKIRKIIVHKGHILIGARDGLYELNAANPEKSEQYNEYNITGLVSKGDTLLLGTINRGVIIQTPTDTLSLRKDNSDLNGDASRSVFMDFKNRIWVCSKKGLASIDKTNIQLYDRRNGLEHDNVKVIFEDREKNLWIGTDGGGMYKFSGEQFVGYTTKEGLASNIVMSITENSDGIWFSTYGGGVTQLTREGTSRHFNRVQHFRNNTIWCSETTTNDRVYFGTSEGISVKDENGLHPLSLDSLLDETRITALYEYQNRLFIGHRQGLSVLENETLRALPIDVSRVRSIIEEPSGSLLIACSEGVFRLDQETWEASEIGQHEELRDVYSLAVNKGQIWAGNQNGLFVIHRDATQSYTLSSTSGSNLLNFLELENDSILWAGTNHGIYQINLSRFESDGEITSRHFTPSDGIRSFETNLNACFTDNSGYIWFGTVQGAVRYDKANATSYVSNLPLLNFEEIQLSLNKTDWRPYAKGFEGFSNIPKELRLPYNRNHLTFKYRGVSQSFPAQVRYQTKLDGFDEDWNPLSDIPFITYSNLPPGEYNFNVRASINENDWTSIKTFGFVIRTPFWQTWWFYTLCSLAVLSILYAIYLSRLRSLRQKQRTEKLIYKSRLVNLEQQSLNASMNRHFIFNALNSIQYYINREDKLSANRYLSSFAKLIRKNLDSSSSHDNLVSLAEELERLELYLSLEYMRFQDKFKYQITVNPGIDLETVRVPAMFLQPYVENSIWHGVLPMKKPGKIDVIVELIDNSIIFEINDNGIGIDASMERKKELSSSHDSKGMKITESRINVLRKITNRKISLQGPFQRHDAKGNPAGTSVKITYPLS